MTAQSFHTELESRLVRYCAIDSQSDEHSTAVPSTAIQLNLAHLLHAELAEIGAADILLTDYGAVLATIPATAKGPTIGFLAHMDTAPQFNAAGVKPRVIRGYNGGAITYPDDTGLTLSPDTSPYLAGKVGHDIVTASGLTLLGADDKAGVSIVMTAARHLLNHPEIPHGPIRIAFTPDEEIGRGVNRRLPEDLGVQWAYTFDGGELGEIEYETFSADAATVTFTGVSIHPGYAKGKMVNALTLASRFLATLPPAQTPEATDGRQGFLHPYEMTGTSAKASIGFILRHFERDGLEAQGALLKRLAEAVTTTEPEAHVEVAIRPQYRNMRYWLEQDMSPVELARDACRSLGIEPKSSPVRGGTDGSRLTEMGVPCPNLFTGMQDIHGPREWVSVQDMAVATQLMLAIATRAAG
jgi:tripeptide aminopeptidase